MLIIGVDENGLGPLLGPMIVTAVAFEADAYDAEQFWKLAGPDLPADDSKAIFTRKESATGEAATLAWLGVLGIGADSYASLVRNISVAPPIDLPCTRIADPCVTSADPLPRWCAGSPEGLTLGTWDRFDRLGIRPRSAASTILCPGAFNRLLEEPGMNKLSLDFKLMLRLVSGLADGYEGHVLAMCGKIGSTRAYGPWFDANGVPKWESIMEGGQLSTYRVDGLGEMSFIRDGDDSHLPIAVASMIGKYLRELAMLGLNRSLADVDHIVASGYRDKITARFVRETTARRAALGLVDDCFLRRS